MSVNTMQLSLSSWSLAFARDFTNALSAFFFILPYFCSFWYAKYILTVTITTIAKAMANRLKMTTKLIKVASSAPVLRGRGSLLILTFMVKSCRLPLFVPSA